MYNRPVDTTRQQPEPTPFEKFEDLARKVFTTPKADVAKTEAEERTEKEKAATPPKKA